MTEKFSRRAQVGEEMAGMRLDQVAARLFDEFSRARLQAWIKQGCLQVDQRPAKAKDKLLGGEELSLEAEAESQVPDYQAQPMALDIIHEDEALMVINKGVGMVVHPAVGNRDGTLLNALLHHCPSLESLPRAGIVHRLDKDTSGLMVVAKTLASHRSLVAQLQDRSLSREYLAVVQGVMTAGGSVDAPLGRHPVHRTKRAVVQGSAGKQAVSHYRVEKRFRSHTLVSVRLETGRTHQIRVHMAHIGHPLVGDPAYGGRLKLPKAASAELIDALRGFRRQALHAWRLGLEHPLDGEYSEWQCDMPRDMQTLLAVLEADGR